MKEPTCLIPAFVNPEAGNGEAAGEALGKLACFDVRHVAPGVLGDLVRAEIERGATRVLVAGGDGSIGAAANALCGRSCELAIMPAGTLNHLAQDLGLPLDLDEAARVAAGVHTARMDVAELNGRIFLNTSSVGAYVTFVHTRERLERRLGYWVASFVAGLRILSRMRTLRVTVEVDGVERQYVTPLVFIGVGERELKLPTLGKRVADGRSGLHVMVVRSRSGARTLALALAAAARGTEAAARTPAMDAFLVDRVRIEPRRPVLTWNVAVDGEIVKLEPPLEYRLVPGGLTVVVAGAVGDGERGNGSGSSTHEPSARSSESG